MQPRRALSLHEYQNMKILKEFGLEVPRGEVAETVEQARVITVGFGESLVACVCVCVCVCVFCHMYTALVIQ